MGIWNLVRRHSTRSIRNILRSVRNCHKKKSRRGEDLWVRITDKFNKSNANLQIIRPTKKHGKKWTVTPVD